MSLTGVLEERLISGRKPTRATPAQTSRSSVCCLPSSEKDDVLHFHLILEETERVRQVSHPVTRPDLARWSSCSASLSNTEVCGSRGTKIDFY